MHVYYEEDLFQIKVQGLCTISCICFLMEKTHACSQGFILEDCIVLKEDFSTWLEENHPIGTMQGNRSLEGIEECMREAKIACEHL